MKLNYKLLSVFLCISSSLDAALLDWNYVGNGPGHNGFGSGGGATLADATYIGNGTGTNEWDVGAGAGSSATNSNSVVTNIFNSTALTGGFDVAVSVDASGQTQAYNETYPAGGVKYLLDTPAVGQYLDGGTDDALSIRINSSSGTLPVGNSSVTQASLINGTSTWQDLTPETIKIKIDPTGAVMSDANFNLYEIELLSGAINGPSGFADGDGNWDHERVVITGYTEAGLSVLPTLTKLVSGTSWSPDISGNSASGRDWGQHSNPDTGVNVAFDSTKLDYIEIEYEMRRITTVGGYSFGLGVGDISYNVEAAPEPSSSLLILIGGIPCILRRKRRD